MLVVDASAVVDLLLDTPVGRRVGELLRADDALTPELMDVEVLSALARLVRSRALSAAKVGARARSLQRMPVQRIPHRALTARAWELRDRVRVADAFYVASAELIGAALLTTDRRLGRAALPGVTITVVS